MARVSTAALSERGYILAAAREKKSSDADEFRPPRRSY
jgi:hypothetical protein